MGARAVLPDMKESLGLGPRAVEVTWEASGFRKMEGSKYFLVRGGSCWMFLITV